MAANSTHPTIASMAKECLDRFFESLELLKVANSRNSAQYWTSLLNQLGRFQIWSSNIGVFADLHASLDYRLRDVTDVQDQILQLLISINDCLQQGKHRPSISIYTAHSFSVQEDCQVEPQAWVACNLEIAAGDFNEMKVAIQESIDWLHRLSNSIRKASSYGQNERAKNFPLTNPDDPTSKDLTPRWIELYSEIVKREFPGLAGNLRSRLARSIVLRRKRIMYRQSRNKRWAIQQESYLRKDPKKMVVPQIAPNTAPSSAQDSLKTKPLTQRSYAYSQLTATTLQPERLMRLKAHSSMSSALTTPLSKQYQIVIPPPPCAARVGEDFVCNYCCTILKCVEGLNANKWS
jgi:hypothetical protein